MKLLSLNTQDYELTVSAEGADVAFKRAVLRNANIETATKYTFDGGETSSFNLAECEDNCLKDKLKEADFNKYLHPVFFENKDYCFDLIFNSGTDVEPIIYSPLQEVKKSFISRMINGKYVLTGNINYANDIGKSDLSIKYRKNGSMISHRLSFEIFPVKLDYKADYKNIISDINYEFTSLVFDILKKTYSGFKEGDEINNDIVWWGIFGQLYKDILLSAKLILNKPHNRLVRNNYYSKADRIKFINRGLEEQIAEHRYNTQKYYKVDRKTLTLDTLENQFFKFSVFYVLRKFLDIKKTFFVKYRLKISDDFKEELDRIEKEFTLIRYNPFFDQVSDFKGFKQESLVLHKATGYSTLFRSWIILKKGIDLLDGINKIEMKNIAELYEIWCFIEMKNIIKDILGKDPVELNLAEILISGFTISLRSGKKSRITYKKENGDLIELFHELKYTDALKDNTISHTINQDPDIVLRITKNDMLENPQLTYLFDAKYRIDDLKSVDYDYPTDESINQMHRYRDAIYYQIDREEKTPKKEVIGAYVLFPGTDSSEKVKDLSYQKSINKVNIGAFPLVPGVNQENKRLLIDFLKEKLDIKDSVRILREEVAPYKSMKYEEQDAYVLAGFMSNEEQKNYFKSGNAIIYHMPASTKIRLLNKLKYFCPVINGVEEFYEIIEIKVMPRSEVFASGHSLYKNRSDSYFVFFLKNRKPLGKTIETSPGNSVFRYARLSELRSCNSISEFNKVRQN